MQPSTEILSRLSRQAYHEVKEDAFIANAKRRTQKGGAQTIDLFAQKLCTPLRETGLTYVRELKSMHPFEMVVMELTVRARRKRDGLTLKTLLAEIHDGRMKLLQLSKDWIIKVKLSSNTKEAYECTEEAKESIGKAFGDLIDGPWTGIMELQRSLHHKQRHAGGEQLPLHDRRRHARTRPSLLGVRAGGRVGERRRREHTQREAADTGTFGEGSQGCGASVCQCSVHCFLFSALHLFSYTILHNLHY